tara:strand:+ start:5555 stop:7354 length:1800 start_codon:yes stop_codon:yes gene_type:complete
MTVTITALQKQRRDTASNWTTNNTVLLAGEWGIESDTKKFKIGDGSTAWQSLDYVPIPDTNRLLTGNLTVGTNLNVSGNAVVTGDLTVSGTTTTVNTTNLDIEDKNITLGKVSNPSDTLADGGGITLKGSTDKTFNWVDATDSWTSSEHFSVSGQKEIRYLDSDSSHHVGFKAPSTVTSNVVWTLPATDAAVNGYVLASDASGNLSWVDPGSTTNPTFTGDLTIQNDGNIRGIATVQAIYTGSTKVLTVTVASKTAAHRYNGTGSSNGYKIDGYESPFITLTPGRVYKFDQADSSNTGHPLRFYLEADKTTAYTTNVATSGTPGSSGAYTEITVTDDTPSVLHYQCSSHAYMGNAVSTNSNVVNADRITSGTIPDARFPATLPAISGANLTNLPAANLSNLNATNLTSGTVPDARFPATLPASSGVNLTALNGSNITSGTIAAARVATLNQDTTGSAATLTTPRAINGVNFDGSAAITIADSTKMPLTGGTFSAEVIFQKEITETVFAITDASSVALDPINGMIQTWTLGANRTATDSLTTGQSMLLIITASGSNYSLTWPTITWRGGSAPTLGGATPTAIELFKVGSTLYGANVGDLG